MIQQGSAMWLRGPKSCVVEAGLCAGYKNVMMIRKSRSTSNLIRNLIATLFYLFRIVKHDK